MHTAHRWFLPLCLAAAMTTSGCDGCSSDHSRSKATPAATAPAALAAPTPATPTTARGASAEAASPEAEPYRGPTSTNPAGYTITTGFRNVKDESVSQPSAVEETTVMVTAMAPNQAPIGELAVYGGAEMHGFLIARDLRHARYWPGTGRVAPNADARALRFMAPEGGSHGLITVFQRPGQPPQAVSAPVTFRGALPKIAGRGVAGLNLRSRIKGGDAVLNVSRQQPKVGEELVLTLSRVDNSGNNAGQLRPAFLAIFNDQIGGGEVLQFSDAGTARWRPTTPGVWLVIAPPIDPRSDVPLTFGLRVEPDEPKRATP